MPLVRIDAPETLGPARLRALTDAVHDAMVETIAVPPKDRFQVIAVHPRERLIIDPEFPAAQRSAEAVLVHITLRAGRADERKRALYARIVELAGARAGLRPDDVMILLAENTSIDWSFASGLAHYAPAA